MPKGYGYDKPYIYNDKIHVVYIKTEDVYGDEGIVTEVIQSNLLYLYNLNGEVIKVINLNFDIFEDNFSYQLVPSNDETIYFIDVQPRTQKLMKISYDGTVIWEMNYRETFNLEGWSVTHSTYIDAETNYLYMLNLLHVNNIPKWVLLVVTDTGEPVDKFEIDKEAKQVLKSPNGEILIQCSDPQGILIRSSMYYAVGMDSKRLIEYELPKLPEVFNKRSNFVSDIYYGSNFAVDYEMYYKNEYGLYGYYPETTESELLVNWTNSDLLGQYTTVLSIITPDVVLCGLQDIYSQLRWYSRETPTLALLTRISDDEAAKKTILTISAVDPKIPEVLLKTVVMFNRQSDKYRVIIDNYGVHVTGDNYGRGVELFDYDIASGVFHDMNFITSWIEKYTSKGMCADLYEFFDKDHDISREHLLGCVRQYNETDGHLYVIPSYFTINTLTGKSYIVGANETLTIDEIIKINDNLPPNTTLFTNCNRKDILLLVLRAVSSEYINYKNAKCNFIDSSFIKMIEFLKTLPDNIGIGSYSYDFANAETIEKVRNNNSYLFEFSINSIESFINLKYIYDDEDYTIKGFPNQTGNGSLINNFDFFTINSKSPNKEGSWEFIKFYLSDEIQLYQEASLPITNSAVFYILDYYLRKHIYTNKNYISTMALQILDEPIEQLWRAAFDDFHFTEANAAEIRRFLNEVPVVPKYDYTAMNIIREEISAFFAGAVTAEQCAKYIQNRVSTYLNEQK